MSVEEILAMITNAGWYTRVVEVNGENSDSSWCKLDCTFRAPDGSIAGRMWWVDLHHGSAMKKYGYGRTLAEALLHAWEREEVERESLYLRHPQPKEEIVDIMSIVLPQKPVYRRF